MLVGCKTAPDTAGEVQSVPPASTVEAVDAPEPEPEPELEPEVAPEPEPQSSLAEPGSHVPRPRVPRNLMFQATALARTVAQARQGIVFTTLPGQGENGSNLVRGTAEDLELASWYGVEDCARAVDAAHALSFERVVTKFGVYDISTVRIDHDAKMIWSAALACEQLVVDETACEGDVLYEVPSVRSIAGPIISFAVKRLESRACGTPQSVLAVHTVDVRRGRPAPFGAIIEPDSLVAGLVRNSVLRRASDPSRLDKANSLDEVWEAWGVRDFASFGAYYFSEWSAERGQVAMHLSYRVDPAEVEPQELVVWATPKAQFRAAFEAAASGDSGFLAAPAKPTAP